MIVDMFSCWTWENSQSGKYLLCFHLRVMWCSKEMLFIKVVDFLEAYQVHLLENDPVPFKQH